MANVLYYAIAFLAGGYLIPASMHFGGIFRADQMSADHPALMESILTALIASACWPVIVTRYVGRP